MLWKLFLTTYFLMNFVLQINCEFPSQEDFDYVEDLIDNLKTRQSNERTKVKIGSFAPSSTRLIENVDPGHLEPMEGYYQQPAPQQQLTEYQPQYGSSSVPHSYGHPASYPDHYYHHHQPTTDHHYYHHNHGSSSHHDSHDHQPTTSTASPSSIVRQQSSEPSPQNVVRYISLPVNPRQPNRSPSTSPWLWSLLFIIIFPTLLGAILLPLALVFLTNIVFVLLMLRNNNQQTTIIPNPQTKLRSRSFAYPFQLDENNIQLIFKLLHKANAIYGSSKFDFFS